MGIGFINAPLVQFPFSEHESQLPLPQPMHREHSDCLPMVVGQACGHAAHLQTVENTAAIVPMRNLAAWRQWLPHRDSSFRVGEMREKGLK